VRKILVNGVPDGMHVPQEVELAETLGQFLPWVGSWWFCRNHDEAFRALLSWLRTTRNKKQVMVLDGGARLTALDDVPYQGSQTLGVTIAEVPGWDVDEIAAAIKGAARRTAAVIIDPLMTRLGLIPPPPGALAQIAETCRRHKVALVFDERVTGFRVDRGGTAAWTEVEPDVAVFGGALGGGFPIGVVAFARAEQVTPWSSGAGLPVPHPVSLAAAEAVLSILKNATTYERLEGRAEQLVEGITALAERFNRPLTVNRVGSAFALYMTAGPVVGAGTARQGDRLAYRRIVEALLGEGVLMPADPCTTAFVSNAHGAKDIDETLAAVERVLMRFHQEDLP
jgi:glutamate-1-semialdehyde 2,1-aminomutase